MKGSNTYKLFFSKYPATIRRKWMRYLHCTSSSFNTTSSTAKNTDWYRWKMQMFMLTSIFTSPVSFSYQGPPMLNSVYQMVGEKWTSSCWKWCWQSNVRRYSLVQYSPPVCIFTSRRLVLIGWRCLTASSFFKQRNWVVVVLVISIKPFQVFNRRSTLGPSLFVKRTPPVCCSALAPALIYHH